MDKFVLGIFVDEVIHQCEFALISWENLQIYLADLSRDWREVEDRVFWNVQSFLVAVANISKFLWPIEEYKSRGEELRRVLQIPMDSPIKDKRFRNIFEHYDEKIEKWASTSKKKHISDMNISIEGFSAIPVLDPNDCLRNLDISRDRKNLTLTFHRELYDLSMTERAVRELLERAKRLRPDLWS